jgi:DNA modification methylase
MVDVFCEVRRVLRPDGTCWLNLGDSYMGGGRRGGAENCKQRTNVGSLDAAPNQRAGGYKQKDLVGIPWMVAFALRADGWYLRQDIIWSKPNPMPESVTDRCTKAHEYLFLLSKSERYYYDAEAIKEPIVRGDAGSSFTEGKTGEHQLGRARGRPNGASTFEKFGHNTSCGTPQDGLRNKRSVWEVTTQPFSLAHFATFPPALIEPCIKAGCPKGGTVLDPFGGAGTTGMVADRLGRNAVLIELNPEYVAMAERRIKSDAGMFAEVSA